MHFVFIRLCDDPCDEVTEVTRCGFWSAGRLQKPTFGRIGCWDCHGFGALQGQASMHAVRLFPLAVPPLGMAWQGRWSRRLAVWVCVVRVGGSLERCG